MESILENFRFPGIDLYPHFAEFVVWNFDFDIDFELQPRHACDYDQNSETTPTFNAELKLFDFSL